MYRNKLEKLLLRGIILDISSHSHSTSHTYTHDHGAEPVVDRTIVRKHSHTATTHRGSIGIYTYTKKKPNSQKIPK